MPVTRFLTNNFSAVRYSRLTWPGEERKPVVVNIDTDNLKVYSSHMLQCGLECDGTSLVVLGNFFDDEGSKVVCGIPSKGFEDKCISGCQAHELIKPHITGYSVMCSHAHMIGGELPKEILKADIS